uniref:DUF4336 domain-containing protein n=1 Tax=Octactis speculum TaxID=3111310 RepID=A0A7S2AMT3_9STRA|mmetsp:Transcript_12723/g.16823  ORF Transcript_12723/g.16823 Transcript_12723/m.16823 type:complete len:493 (+) Transcript_12723:21-1499(+)
MKSLLALYIPLTLAFQHGRHEAIRISQRRAHREGLSSATIDVPPSEQAYSWPLGRFAFSLIPLAPGERRRTVEECVIRDQIWTHDQIQGIVNVNVPVRQTVIALKGGGLWVHNPVAPTDELLSMMRDLEAKYGPVKHVVLGTVALEHKATAGPFSKCFPDAQVWLQPGQWSFPVSVPCFIYGFQGSLRTIPYEDKTGRMPKSGRELPPPPWSDEIDHHVLGPLKFKSVGYFSETAFFHKASKTLLVTDTIIKVDEEPPAIIQEDPRALVFHARDDIGEELVDSVAVRRKGWRRMVQFGLIFFPSCIEVVGFGEALRDALTQVPESMRTLGTGAVPLNLYPWRWAKDDKGSFEALLGGGTQSDGRKSALLVAPILQKIILNREPEVTLDWVDKVCEWPFKRIIPCHLSNDLRANPESFRQAFTFLETQVRTSASAKEADLALLTTASDLLTKAGVIAPQAPLVTPRKLPKKVFSLRPSFIAQAGEGNWFSWFT